MKYVTDIYPWLVSLRLKTLPLAVSSIFVGNALAYWQHTFSWSIFILTWLTASLLQILSNLANDYGDGIKGVDDETRIGPKRGLHSGNITLNQLFWALIINTFLCVVIGLWLLILAYESSEQLISFICLGVLSIVAAITYTVGKKAYGYIGLGDLSVLLFFGLVSVLGSFYLQAKFISLWLLLPAIACGLLSVAVLNINNLRDYASDKANNKRTFIVFIGPKLGRFYHISLLILSFCLFSFFSLCYLKSYCSWLFLLSTPSLYKQILEMYRTQEQIQITYLLEPMIKLALITNLLYVIGIILS